MEYNSSWFKENLVKEFAEFKLEYRYFPEGDFGSLDEVVFESEKIGGTISYWGMGYLGIFVYDYINETEIMNVLIEPMQIEEKEKSFEALKRLLV